jgi:folate-binding protein YgfZ
VFFQNLIDVSVPPLPFPVVEVSDRLLGAPGKLGLWSRSGGGNESLESLALPLGATWMTAEDFETMRVEGGVPKWGVDVGEDVSPLEISLDAYCDAGKGCYVGQEVVARWRKAGRAPRALMGFRLPRGASAPLDVFCRGAVVGKLTSVVRSPRSGSPLGLAFLPVEVAASPDPLTVRLPEGEFPVEKMALPLQ